MPNHLRNNWCSYFQLQLLLNHYLKKTHPYQKSSLNMKIQNKNRQRISKTNLIYSKIGNSSNELKLVESFTTGA